MCGAPRAALALGRGERSGNAPRRGAAAGEHDAAGAKVAGGGADLRVGGGDAVVLDRSRERYGEAFTLRFFPSGRKIVVVSGGAVKQVFPRLPRRWRPRRRGLADRFGDGAELGVAPTARPGAHPSAPATAAAVPRGTDERVRGDDRGGHAAARYADVADGEPASMQERTRAITLEVILRAVFGVCPVTDPLA